MSSGASSGISNGTSGAQGNVEQMNSEAAAIQNEQKISASVNAPIHQPGDLRYSRKKTEGYLLNKNHPKGGSKAKFMEDVLGYSKSDSRSFHKAVTESIIGKTSVKTQQTEYGLYIGSGNIPHRVKQPLSGKHDPAIVDESQQKAVFKRRKKQVFVIFDCGAFFGVHYHIAELYGLSRASCEPENVFDAGKKLSRTKRLRYIIVGTEVKARNGAVFIAGGGQKNDGQAKFGFDGSARGKAVALRQG